MPSVSVSAPLKTMVLLEGRGASMSKVFQMGATIFLQGGIEDFEKNQIKNESIRHAYERLMEEHETLKRLSEEKTDVIKSLREQLLLKV